MKTLHIFIGIGGIVIITLGALLFLSLDNDNTTSNTTPLQTTSPTGEVPNIADSRYLPYSPEILTTNTNKRRVLYFYANWCPTCRPADSSFKNNQSQIPDDVVVIRVNYNDTDTDDNEDALANQYGITYQHTFVQIDESGNEVTKWNGGDLTKLLSSIK